MSQPTKHVEVPVPVSPKLKSYRLAALILAACVVVSLFLWPLHTTLLTWDEVDYFNAAQAGLSANALDTNSMGPREFISFARAKRTGLKQGLPPNYVEERDALLLRHYHPPFIFYLTSLATSISGSTNEHVVRAGQLLGAFALICVMVFAYLGAFKNTTWPGLLAVLVFALGLSYLGFYFLSCHGWLAVWTTLTAALYARWLAAGKAVTGILTCMALALAILTLEMGVVTWASTILCLIFWKPISNGRFERANKSIHSGIWIRARYIIVGTVLVSLFVICLWPGSVLKISIIKTPLVLLYRASLGQDFVRSASPFLVTLPLACLIALAGAWLFYRRRATIRQWGPFLVTGTLYWLVLVVITPFALTPTYFVPAFAPLGCLLGPAVDSVVAHRNRGFVKAGLVIIILSAVMVTIGAGGLPLWPHGGARNDSDINWLANNLRGRQTLADGAHIYRHYLGDQYQIEPISLSVDQTEVLKRENGEYRRVSPEEISGKFLVILKMRAKFVAGQGKAIKPLPDGCHVFELNEIRVYDCVQASMRPK